MGARWRIRSLRLRILLVLASVALAIVSVTIGLKLARLEPAMRAIRDSDSVVLYRAIPFEQAAAKGITTERLPLSRVRFDPQSALRLDSPGERRALIWRIRRANLTTDSWTIFGFSPKVVALCTGTDGACELVFGVGGNTFGVHRANDRSSFHAGDGLTRSLMQGFDR